MFDHLQVRPTDALLGLMAAYRADPRPTKIDVGVGVYRDESGQTPVMKAIKQAEEQLFKTQHSKTYLGMLGEPLFNSAMLELVLGEGLLKSLGGRVKGVQTTGGCAALRALADLIATTKPNATVWLSQPTWVNHAPLIGAARLKLDSYPYFDANTQSVDFEAMVAKLKTLGSDDVVLLHGACHNPTGADLSLNQWQQIADLAKLRGFLPFVDLAYQGLGLGMDQDAQGVRLLAEQLPEVLVAVSCSKSFGIYRDRVGCAMVIGSNDTATQNMMDHLLTLIRGNYSMPPDHGAACVQMILNTPALRTVWSDELTLMRNRITQLRAGLSKGLREASGTQRYNYIERQLGMFSLLGLNSTQVVRLRDEFGIYMPADSRTNIAGLNTSQIAPFVKAVLSVS